MRLITLSLAAPLILLASCAGPADPAHDPTGTWTGMLVPDEGTCPTATTSTLRIRGSEILFSPGDMSQVLRGTYRRGTDHYHAELAATDMNHHPTPLVFNGYPVGQGIGGIYGSQECRAHIALTRR